MVKAQAGIVPNAHMFGKELSNGREGNAFDHFAIRVGINDDFIEAAVGGEQITTIGAELQAETTVEGAPSCDA